MTFWKKLFRGNAAPARQAGPASVPPGTRVYAVGDIHGRLDLFRGIMQAIDADDSARGSAQTSLVLLGDLIDRGPDSAGVVTKARRLARERPVSLLMGNHEEMFLQSFSKVGVLRSFLRFGGRETILSYGVPEQAFAELDPEELQQVMTAAVPRDHREFLAGFEKMVRFGDYVFVHAGIDPEMPLDRQTGQNCRWIREPFLSHEGDFGAIVVHGHTVTDAPEVLSNRIGIDTGAFQSGTLTAIGLEGTERWMIQAQEQGDGEISSLAWAA